MRRIVAGALLLGGLLAHGPTGAADLAYQAVMHVRTTHSAPVLDSKDHVIGVAAFRGLAIFDDGAVAVHRYDGWFDLQAGVGPFHGYALWQFEDGSTLRARYDGAARPTGGGSVAVEARLHDITGTGRFAGTAGTGTFTGRRLDSIEDGGSTHLTGVLTLEMPE